MGMADHRLAGPAIRYSDIGVLVAIFAFVTTQFVDVSLFSIGTVQVTVQKIVAILALPLAVVLIGHIRMSRGLAFFALVLLIAYSISYLVNRDLSADLASGAITVLIGFFGALVLYTALTHRRDALLILGKTWIVFAVCTAVITILQAAGAIPLFNVPADYLQSREAIGVAGLYRGVGLKYDPNFQAVMLVLGLVFAQFYLSRHRFPVTVLIVLGIIATFSRMGVVLGMLILTGAPAIRVYIQRRSYSRMMLVSGSALVLLIAVGFLLVVLGPTSVRVYVSERVVEVYELTASLLTGDISGLLADGSSGSAYERLYLAVSAFFLGLENWMVGVGAYRGPAAIFEFSGVEKPAHNTYLELFLIGGIWGLFAIALYAAVVIRRLWRLNSFDTLSRERCVFILLTWTFAIVGLFISLTYNSLLWLPLVLAGALSHWLLKLNVSK
jgi:hypothetical protein